MRRNFESHHSTPHFVLGLHRRADITPYVTNTWTIASYISKESLPPIPMASLRVSDCPGRKVIIPRLVEEEHHPLVGGCWPTGGTDERKGMHKT